MGNQKKIIAILGGGFAGLQTALLLEKKLQKFPEYEILLVDERDRHLYTPDLYEIATAFNKNITQECLTRLKDSVATPFMKILEGKNIQFIRDRVIKIEPEKKMFELKQGGRKFYDYLVLALGSVTNYHGIPGLLDFSYPLKTLTDALAICCHIDIYFHTLWKDAIKKRVCIVVGGGGSTGVEFASELPHFLNKLCKKYGYPREHVSITVVEGSNRLAGQDEKVTKFIVQRFEKFGIRVLLDTRIKGVTAERVLIEEKRSSTPREMTYDILIWTGGVMPNPLIRESFGNATAENGSLPVTEHLNSQKFPAIFAAGDNARIIDPKTSQPVPQLAQMAFEQAKTVAYNVTADILGNPKTAYRHHFKGVITPVGGKYAILRKGSFIWRGFFIWLLRRLVDLRYFMSILPFGFAVRKWIRDTNVFIEND